MSKLPTRPLAFPNAIPNEFYDYNDGMELRDWFAGQALVGLLGNSAYDGSSPDELAVWAYIHADEMIEERKP